MAAHGLQQVQKQSQSLVLAPQLRQSLKILQVPTLELRNTILQELQINPTLEELPIDQLSLDGLGQGEPQIQEDSSTGDELRFEENLNALHKLDQDWRDHFAQDNPSNVYTAEDADRRQHFFDSLVGETSLQEHLLAQANLVDCSEQQRQALEVLIGSLDDTGFLSTDLSELALLSSIPLAAFQQALPILKSFDPSGIGAADLRECLLIQLQQQDQASSLACRIIHDCYDLLLRRRVPEIARKLGVDSYDIQTALQQIAALNPAPGRKFSDDSNRIIIPDLRIEKDETGEWSVQLNNEYIPHLRLSNTYKELLAKDTLSAADRDYLREHMRSGRFLISAIEQRQQTIKKVVEEIIRQQKDFFDHGVSRLRPLTMARVADAVGVHETTVSRAIANKYAETVWGIFDLKFFFRTGYTSTSGESVSNTSIKERIAQIIAGENPQKPYSDSHLVKILQDEDLKIARRTVAKYREELGILPTHLRRRYS